MERELETAAAASAGGWLRWRKHHAVPLGTPCANCGAALQGPYCHECGQLGEDFHRSIGHLLTEGLESLFHFDGRIWRTLPQLVRNPGKLTRDYLDGRRAFQIPPLRMFLVVLLLVFFCGGLGRRADATNFVVVDRKGPAVHTLSINDKADEKEWRAELQRELGAKAGTPGAKSATVNWFIDRVVKVRANPEQFTMVLETWAHRLAVLMLPIGALLLAALFAFQRQFFIFDHVIFTMHSLSFQGLLVSVFFLAALVSPPLAALLLLAAPAHLFVHMRGVYGASVPGTLARMVVLFAGSLLAFAALMTLLVLIGLNEMGGH